MKTNTLKSQKEEKNERVLVYLRIRPFNEDELKTDSTSPIQQFNQEDNSIISKEKKFKKNKFNKYIYINKIHIYMIKNNIHSIIFSLKVQLKKKFFSNQEKK